MLESTDTLWRYMKLSTFLLLLDGKAWLPSIATLQSMDPLEGRLGDNFHENLWAELHRQGLREETEKWLHEYLDPSMKRMLGLNPGHHHLTSRVLGSAYAEILARRRVAWCWFKSDLESAGMWSIYGNRGIAVRTSPEQLNQSFPAGKERTIEKMIYVDRRPCADMSLQGVLHDQPESILRPYFLKAAEYEHEGEVRLVAHCPEGAAGILVRDIEVGNLINEIVISPLLPLDESEAIKDFLTNLAPKFKDKIKQSDLNGKNAPDMADRVDEVFYGTTDDHMYLAELPPALRKL
jgi:hypothetical protein